MQEKFLPTIHAHIKAAAQRKPGKILIGVDTETVTYEDFIRDVDDIASALLAMGTRVNHKIALIIPNSVIWYKIFWAIVKIGAQPVQ